MKKNIEIYIIISLLFAVALILTESCVQNKKSSNNSMSETNKRKENSLQNHDELIAGVSKAVCYSGFRSGQHPDRGDGAVNPSYDEILEDLKIISENAGFSLIRIYDSGKNSEMIIQVIKDNKLNIKVLLGIWLQAELSNHNTCVWLNEPIPEKELEENKITNLEELERGIALANKFQSIVVAVNVGNEALVDWNDHKVATDTIISYVERVKQAIEQDVTVADNYKWWAEHGADLAKAVDFVSIHIYPVWEGRDIQDGFSFSIENIMEVRKALPEAQIVITEAGWPSVASEFPDHVNEEKQAQYYNEIMPWAEDNNVTIFFFEAFDEDWKGDIGNIDGAEKHWGLFTVDRKPKKVMQ